MAAAAASGGAGAQGQQAAPATLSEVLGEAVKGFAYDKNATLNAALYSYKQSGCDLEAVFSRHEMEPRGRLAVSLPGSFRGSEDQDLKPEVKARKAWHTDSRAQLTALLNTIHTSAQAFYLILWEGSDYEPPPRVRFSHLYKRKPSAVFEARGELGREFKETPVAVIVPMLRGSGGAGGTHVDRLRQAQLDELGLGPDSDSEADEEPWTAEVANEVHKLLCKE